MSEKQETLFGDQQPYGEWYGGQPPHQRHSDTSRKAAKEAVPSAGTERARVLEFVAGRGKHGATDEEIATELGMNPNTERPRRRELQQSELVRDSGKRRKTLSGRQAVVWIARGVA